MASPCQEGCRRQAAVTLRVVFRCRIKIQQKDRRWRSFALAPQVGLEPTTLRLTVVKNKALKTTMKSEKCLFIRIFYTYSTSCNGLIGPNNTVKRTQMTVRNTVNKLHYSMDTFCWEPQSLYLSNAEVASRRSLPQGPRPLKPYPRQVPVDTFVVFAEYFGQLRTAQL